MKSRDSFLRRWEIRFSLAAHFVTVTLHAVAAGSAPQLSTTNSHLAPIPWSALGGKATAQYGGEGLAVFVGEGGTARLRCSFQKLEGELTRDGLWLTSTTEGSKGERFRVVATSVGRQPDFGVRRQSEAGREAARRDFQFNLPTPLLPGDDLAPPSESRVAFRFPSHSTGLPRTGTVETRDRVARFIRPGLVE
jgi:hypothetical protein